MRLSITLDTKALAAAIGRMTGPEVGRIQVRALEKRLNDARKETVAEFTSRGIGRHLFGRNDRGAFALVKVSPPRIQGDTASVTISLRGFAALQEVGGRTKPHIIKPKRAKLLAFGVAGGFGFGGDLVFTKLVKHPGGALPKHEALRPAAEKVLVGVIEDIRRDIAALWDGGKAA